MGHDISGTHCPGAPTEPEPGLVDSLGSEGLDSFLNTISTLHSIISRSEPEPVGCGSYGHRSFLLHLAPDLIFAFLDLCPLPCYMI